MKNLHASLSHSLVGELAVSRFEAAKALAYALAESDKEMLEPELIAWVDRPTNMASPEIEGYARTSGWRDYGMSHGGLLEIDIGDESAFIFVESSPFDSYEHFGHGAFVNLRDESGNEMLCRIGGKDCVPLDEWSSKLT
jgi:hypothetical protein